MADHNGVDRPIVDILSTLTADEKVKLRETWSMLLQLCGVEDLKDQASPKTAKFLQSLPCKSDQAFRDTLWRAVHGDHPDAILLRFLRARKWDVELAVNMLVSAVNWRDEIKIDESIIYDGENVALQPQPSISQKDRDFIAQYRSGKAYARGADREGRLVYIIKVRLHKPSAQSPEAMERFILHSIESLKMVVRSPPPHDQVCLVFDLTSFGMANMDFHVVKFIIQVFEARYPETLGIVLVHNAPFIFWGVWNIIKHWLDPVIASKINFTSGKSGLAKHIPDGTLQKEYGGKDDWQYRYIEPVAGENDKLGAEEKTAELHAHRSDLIEQFETLTSEWVKSQSGDQERAQRRDAVVRDLQDNYWKLDPYIRARTYYHRAGVIDPSGSMNLTAAQ